VDEATRDEARALRAAVLSMAKERARDADALVEVVAVRRANTRFAVNEVTTTGDAVDLRATLTLAFGKRHAKTSSNQTDPGALSAMVERTMAMARLAPEDPEQMPLLPQQEQTPVPAAWDEAAASLGADARAAAAKTAIDRARGQSLTVAGYFEHSGHARFLGSSAGLETEHRGTELELTMSARTADGTGSGWAGAVSHRAADVDAAELAAVACDKAARAAQPEGLEPGRYTVILEPAAVVELLTFLVGSLDARSADEGRSFFTKKGGGTRVGEKLFADGVALRSDPTDPLTPGTPFDGDGLPLRPTTWIEGGTLRGLFYSRYWAAKQAQAATGRPGVWHLGGGTAASVNDLFVGVERGLLVTRLWYTRWVDPQALLITGLTRDGVFLVENGQVTRPVKNFRFNESPAVMLKNADLLTRDTVRVPSWAGLIRVPALRTHEFNMASTSAAI
jgi:predicted Zn-dependent protease